MPLTHYRNIIIVTIFLFVYSVSGEPCVKSDGTTGRCAKLSECPSAIALVKKGERPKACGFLITDITICCEENLETLNEPFPPGCKDTWKHNFDYVDSHIYNGPGINSLTQYPHMAALGFNAAYNKTVWRCEGTLITTEHVLTAAHCLHSKTMGDIKYVRLGDLNLNSDEDDAEPQNFKVLQIIRHPDYNPESPYNDLAIIKLDKPCKITSYVIPTCLNTKKELPHTSYSASGWDHPGNGEDNLQNMIIKVYNQTECQKAYSNISKKRLHLPKGIIEETQVCAGAPGIKTFTIAN